VQQAAETAAQAIEQTPFYADWGFWAAVMAALAILLSQLPPVRHLLRGAKLDIELYSWIGLLHKVGNTNASIHVILQNIGGRDVRVKSLEAFFRRDQKWGFALPAENYYPTTDFKDQRLLTPFTLKPEEEWAHAVSFFQRFERKEEKLFRELESNLKADIASKLPTDGQQLAAPVEADHENVKPLLAFFNERFRWIPGEYEVTVTANTEPRNALKEKTYRFVLYESDSEGLRSNAEGYKYGDGIYWDSGKYPPVTIAITAVGQS
jgi:hypothetical protein